MNDGMQFQDPRALKILQAKDAIIFASAQLTGARERQEDYFVHYKDECFVIADGVGGMPHGDVAAKLAGDTALWGYKHIRQRHTYWQDKKLFVKRIFRSANIAVWQKRRETGFEEGLAATLVVFIVGAKTFWLGSVGDSSAFFLRNGIFKKLTIDDVDERGYLTKVVGAERFGLVPQFVTDQFLLDDTMLLGTDGITHVLSEEEIKRVLVQAGRTTESVADAVRSLLSAAQKEGSTDNMTACLVKRIPL